MKPKISFTSIAILEKYYRARSSLKGYYVQIAVKATNVREREVNQNFHFSYYIISYSFGIFNMTLNIDHIEHYKDCMIKDIVFTLSHF